MSLYKRKVLYDDIDETAKSTVPTPAKPVLQSGQTIDAKGLTQNFKFRRDKPKTMQMIQKGNKQAKKPKY